MQEHCELHGHAERFTTDNYGLTTTPEDEYRIATGQMKCPEEARKDREGRVVREVKPLAVLKALPDAQRAKLVEMEVTAVVRAALIYVYHTIKIRVITHYFQAAFL